MVNSLIVMGGLVDMLDAFKALAGPYIYQSASGLVVAQLNSELLPDVAAKIDAALKGL